MNPDLYIVRKVNEATSVSRKASLFMDLVTRYGHWAFVIYGLLLWFAPGEGRKALLRAVLRGCRDRLSPFLCHRQGVEKETAF